MWKCPECGVVKSTAATCVYCHKPAPADAVIDSPKNEWSVFHWWRFLRFVIGGVVCLVIGVTMLVAELQGRSVAGIYPGAAFTFAGVAGLGLAVFTWKRG